MEITFQIQNTSTGRCPMAKIESYMEMQGGGRSLQSDQEKIRDSFEAVAEELAATEGMTESAAQELRERGFRKDGIERIREQGFSETTMEIWGGITDVSLQESDTHLFWVYFKLEGIPEQEKEIYLKTFLEKLSSELERMVSIPPLEIRAVPEED